MSQARRAVGLRFFDGTRTRRARLHDQALRQARRAVGRGVLPKYPKDGAEGMAT